MFESRELKHWVWTTPSPSVLRLGDKRYNVTCYPVPFVYLSHPLAFRHSEIKPEERASESRKGLHPFLPSQGLDAEPRCLQVCGEALHHSSSMRQRKAAYLMAGQEAKRRGEAKGSLSPSRALQEHLPSLRPHLLNITPASRSVIS